MSITRRLYSIIFVAIAALVGAVLLGQPALGVDSTVTGTVTSSNGPVAAGRVGFYATCQDYQDYNPAGYADFTSGTYEVIVPDGTYRVWIVPYSAGVIESWHSAKPTCAEANVVTVSGNTPLNLVALPGSTVTGTVSSSNGPVTQGYVEFYATCQDYEDGEEAGSGYLQGGAYTVTVPDGTYRVRITPYLGLGAVRSWHNAERTCAEATVVTVSGNGTQDLVAMAGRTVTGTVSSSNGPVDSGAVFFYATCQDYEDWDPADYTQFWDGDPYSVTVADGTYHVWIWPDDGTGALESWHSAKPSCDQADVVTVSGNTKQDLVAVPGSDVTGTVSSSNGAVESGDVFFFATCQDYDNGNDLLNAYIDDGVYTLTVPDGSYRVLIDPDDEYGALESWHSAKPTCDQATLVTVAGDTTVNLVAMAEGASPSPTPSVSPSTPGPTPTQSTPPPPPPPPPGNQTVKKPPAKLKTGKSATLAQTSAQGTRLMWRSTTKKVCKVKKSKVKGLKKGKCVLKATAPATSTFLAYSQKFTIRVK